MLVYTGIGHMPTYASKIGVKPTQTMGTKREDMAAPPKETPKQTKVDSGKPINTLTIHATKFGAIPEPLLWRIDPLRSIGFRKHCSWEREC